jgi:tetratricopeptide (TPR) repeat protein
MADCVACRSAVNPNGGRQIIGMPAPRKIALGFGVLVLLLLALWRFDVFRTARQAPAEQPVVVPSVPLDPPAYVGSSACARCHAEEYQAWQGSQHAMAMQVADEQTVLGNFNGARFRNFGVISEFFRREGKFMVRTDGPDGKLADFEVRHVFGVYPLQQYLIELPGGNMQALSIAWDSRPADQGGQRWFHLYPNERIDHRDELHWTQRQQNWNYMCADCHSTNLQKQYDAEAGTYATTWSEISVGCEACHGPGSNHIALAESAAAGGGVLSSSGLTVALDERRGAARTIDPATGSATRSKPRDTEREIDVCAQCHSRRGQFSNAYQAGEPFQDHYLPVSLDQGLYHPDGQQRDEVYNWGSFLSSRMHAKGVTCGDCHEPHAGKLRAPGNGVCAQCHLASRFDAASHNFHEAGTPGAACASCHMKTETYMVIDPRHDRSFRIPRPDLSTALGVPDACNQCHDDRSARWAAEQIRGRYPEPKPGFQGFAEAFAAADRGEPAATIALTQVAANLEESAIARASALERLAQIPGENALMAAEAALDDPSPLVRRAAIETFDALPPLQRLALVPLLGDPVRTVRMRAARALAPLADDAFDSAALVAFRKASDEYVAAERFNADRPENRTNLGVLRGAGDYAAARPNAGRHSGRRSLHSGLGQSLTSCAQGREADAESTLREGLKLAPADATLHHALGLALVRQQRADEALRELKRATELDPRNARFAYVYQVAREELQAGPAGR